MPVLLLHHCGLLSNALSRHATTIGCTQKSHDDAIILQKSVGQVKGDHAEAIEGGGNGQLGRTFAPRGVTHNAGAGDGDGPQCSFRRRPAECHLSALCP